jgi:hypothetical protein
MQKENLNQGFVKNQFYVVCVNSDHWLLPYT